MIVLPLEHEIQYSKNNKFTGYYCYVYLDPRIPNDKHYKHLTFSHKPIYIGNSVSISNIRYKHHLRPNHPNNIKNKNEYIANMLNETNLSPQKYADNYIKLIYVVRPMDTHLEKYLIDYYGLDTLLNIDPGGALLGLAKSVFDDSTIYDLKLDKEIYISSLFDFVKETGIEHISHLFIGSAIVVLDRYCLPHNVNKCKEYINKHNKLHTLYRYNIIKKQVDSFTRPYKYWIYKINKNNCIRLLTNTNDTNNNYYQVEGYYKNKEDCILYNQDYTLYMFDEINNCIITITKSYNKWRDILGTTTSAILIYGKQQCSYGYYRNIKQCEYEHELITFKHIDTNIIKQSRRCNIISEIGKNARRLVNETIQSCCGYILYNPEVE